MEIFGATEEESEEEEETLSFLLLEELAFAELEFSELVGEEELLIGSEELVAVL